MKKGKTFAKIIAIVTLVAVVLSCAVIFAACNKNKTKSITDIFKMRESYGELTGSKVEFTLPAGWEVYTTSATSPSATNVTQYSDVGYIPELDAFIVCRKYGTDTDSTTATKLSVVKCGDQTKYHEDLIPGMMFHPSQGIRALRYKDGLFVCLFDDGTAGAFDAATGREALSRQKIGKDLTDSVGDRAGYNDTSSGNIDNIIKILCRGLIAVNYNYDHKGTSGYTAIFRPQYEGAQGNRGELVCRVKNSGDISLVNGFDDRYVSVSGSSNGEYMFKIPDHASSKGAEDMEATSRGTFTTNSNTNYADECTYIGGGKFYVSQDWEVSEGKEYTYYNGSKYIMCMRGIYSAESDSFSEINSDKIFNNLTNNYYTSTKAGIDTRSYLNNGYTYVSYGVTVIESNGKKVGLYDQFIIDGDLNIVMSLTGNYGVTIKDQKKDKVSFFDLIMYGVDGLYYVPIQPSEVNLYDAKGNLVGHNDRSNVTMQEYNSNIMVVQTPNSDSSSSSIYGAYDRYGNQIVPFEYDMLSSYRGLYTIGRRYGRKDVEGESTSTRYLCLLGPNGQEIEEAEMIDKDGNVTKAKPFADIAYRDNTQTAANAIYKSGCYMFRVDSGEKDANNRVIYNYGIRNFRPSVADSIIMPATMSAGCVLYASAASPSNVFVFEKVTSTTSSDVTYIVYRLI